MSVSVVLDEAIKYEEEVLGDLEYQAFRWTYIFFRQIYHMFGALKNETGDLEKSNDLYMEACWLSDDMMNSVRDLMREKGLMVNDLESMARLVIEHYKTFGIPVKVFEKRDDNEMLLGGNYCPNPLFSVSPHDNYIDRAAFAQYDGWIGTDNLMNVYVRATNTPFEVVMQRTLCLGLGGCRFLFRKRLKKEETEVANKTIFRILYENRQNWITVTEVRNKTDVTLQEYQDTIRSLKDQGYVETQNVSTGLFGSAKITDIGVDRYQKTAVHQ